jgi:hypothetical protein
LVVVHARDQKLTSSETLRASVRPALVRRQILSFSIRVLAAGDFSGASAGVAALGDDGSVHFLEHSVDEKSLARMIDPNFKPAFQLGKPGPDGNQFWSVAP